MMILIVLMNAVFAWVSQKSQILSAIAGFGFIALLIWLPIRDIKKAIAYYSNTY